MRSIFCSCLHLRRSLRCCACDAKPACDSRASFAHGKMSGNTRVSAYKTDNIVHSALLFSAADARLLSPSRSHYAAVVLKRIVALFVLVRMPLRSKTRATHARSIMVYGMQQQQHQQQQHVLNGNVLTCGAAHNRCAFCLRTHAPLILALRRVRK